MSSRRHFLVVGAGITGATIARKLADAGHEVEVTEEGKFIGGNCWDYVRDGILIHGCGPHIFHTSDHQVWNWANRFAGFYNFVNCPLAVYKKRFYNLPFNMNTFNQLWGITDPHAAFRKIESQRLKLDREPLNLEEQALSLVGQDIYEILIRGYTAKQWGRPCTELPASIIKRLPLRFTFDNNYFNDEYQGIPYGGFSSLIERILSGINVKTEQDMFLEKMKILKEQNVEIIYTGRLDRLFNFSLGTLEFRHIRLRHKYMENINNYQGNAVVNYTEDNDKFPYTRITEHKHFKPMTANEIEGTHISLEYSSDSDGTPAYPIQTPKNELLQKKYEELIKTEGIYFCGRLAEYKYKNMDVAVRDALDYSNKILKGEISYANS